MRKIASNEFIALRFTKGRARSGRLFGLLAALGNVSTATAATKEGIVGAWSLVTFDVDEGKGTTKPRFGPDPVGYLIYSANARMAAVLAGTRRPELKSPAGSGRFRRERTEALRTFWPTPGATKCAAIASSITSRSASSRISWARRSNASSRSPAIRSTIRTLPPEIWGTPTCSSGEGVVGLCERFRAVLEGVESSSATYVRVPASVLATFGGRVRVPVRMKINGAEHRTTIATWEWDR